MRLFETDNSEIINTLKKDCKPWIKESEAEPFFRGMNKNFITFDVHFVDPVTDENGEWYGYESIPVNILINNDYKLLFDDSGIFLTQNKDKNLSDYLGKFKIVLNVDAHNELKDLRSTRLLDHDGEVIIHCDEYYALNTSYFSDFIWGSDFEEFQEQLLE